MTQIVSILLDCKEHKIVDSHNVPLPKTKVLSHVYHLYIPFCIIHFYHLSHTSHVSNQSYVRHLISQMCPIALITSVNPSLVGGGGGVKCSPLLSRALALLILIFMTQNLYENFLNALILMIKQKKNFDFQSKIKLHQIGFLPN